MKEYTIKSKGGIRIGRDITHELILKGYDIEISDGYHTMEELYEHRMALNVVLFNMLAAVNHPDVVVMKSKLHNDGTMFDGYFIVMWKNFDRGQISYHYDLKHWDLFKIPEVERIPFPYDGHTAKDVVERLLKL